MFGLRMFGTGFVVVAALMAATPSAQGVALHENAGAESALPPRSPAEYADFMEALKGGRVYLNFRYRYEYVDADAFSRSANANTLRTVLGYETGAYHGFKGLIEFEDVTDITDNYDSTTNGKTQYPVVADPDSTEVNQAYLEYGGMDESVLRLGRQEILLDNQRFVGNVGWRQNHQSFDAFSWKNTSIENATFVVSYIDQVNRIFSDDSPLGAIETDTFLLNGGYDIADLGKATGYWYYLDNEDQLELSSSTFGFRFAGDHALGEAMGLAYAAEWANQTDIGDNPNTVDQDYYLAELGATYEGVKLIGAFEHLGGSGLMGDSFQTPLATLFKFNGFADQFLTTPDTGLDDYYLMLSGKIQKVGCYAAYHMFESDSGGLDYGTEVDLGFTYPVTPELTAGLQGAAFDGDEGGYTDVTKFWFFLTFAAI